MTLFFKKKYLFTAALLSVFLCAPIPAEGDLVTVRHVLDGDTFDLEGGERVRLIGIDTPEYRPWKNHVDFFGREASEFSRKLLTGKRIRLEKDVDLKDNYGRTLAYVYLEDGTFVNRLLVEEGYARAKYFSPNGRYYVELKRSQEKARKLKKGLWTRI